MLVRKTYRIQQASSVSEHSQLSQHSRFDFRLLILFRQYRTQQLQHSTAKEIPPTGYVFLTADVARMPLP
jgi:hypothetical protein